VIADACFSDNFSLLVWCSIERQSQQQLNVCLAVLAVLSAVSGLFCIDPQSCCLLWTCVFVAIPLMKVWFSWRLYVCLFRNTGKMKKDIIFPIMWLNEVWSTVPFIVKYSTLYVTTVLCNWMQYYVFEHSTLFLSTLLCTWAQHSVHSGKWAPALAGKAKAGMVYSVSGWMRGVQVKLWDPLRMRAIPERLRGVLTTTCYTNPHLPYLT